jgi:hypothetical protein
MNPTRTPNSHIIPDKRPADNADISKSVNISAILGGAPVAADHEALYTTALMLVTVRGWSVVPVLGDLAADPASGKLPAVEWKPYTRRLPTPAELREWFTERGYPGLAVICGDVSGLLVLECDTLDEWQAVVEACPDIANTFTVLSANKKLPHFYLQPPAGVDLRFRGKAGKLELRGNGQYVVAPPTIINDKPYTLLKGGDVLKLTAQQWTQLCDHIEARTGNVYPHDAVSHARQAAADDTAQPVTAGSREQLVSLYHTQVVKHGSRNKGLFSASCLARDSGWQAVGVASALVAEYVQHPPLGEHPPETPEQRRVEALRTLASAFSRPARAQAWGNLSSPGLPTLVREHLLQVKNGSMARILDTLLLSGVRAGALRLASGTQPSKVRLKILPRFACCRLTAALLLLSIW